MLIRTIYVEEPIGAPSPDLGRFSDIIHDTSVRALKELGYVAAVEPSGADAVLYAVWFARPLASGDPRGRVSLRMSLIAHDGTVLRTTDAIVEAQSGFLTRERIADFVRTKIALFAR